MLALPRACSDSLAVFAPFDPHLWFAEEEKTGKHKPLGASVDEAREVAWLLSASAHTSAETIVNAARALAYSARLRREGPIAEALYRNLSRRMDDYVSVTEVEVALGCVWGEVDILVDGRPQRMDPYFWKMLETTVRDSVSDYVTRLDGALCQTRGNDQSQFTRAADEAMERVRRAVAHHVSSALLSTKTTTSTLVELLDRLRTGFATAHVTLAKESIREQIRGVRALSLLVAATPDELDQRLQELDSQLTTLLFSVPLELQEQFAQRGVCVQDLTMVFVRQNSGFVQAPSTVPPPSLAVRAAVLSRWLRRSRDAVAEACVAAMASLRRALDLPPLAPEWGGNLVLCQAEDQRVRRAKPGAHVPWKPPAHLGDGAEPRVLVDEGHSHHYALRLHRFFSVLLQQARLGLLPTRTVRADVMLPIVARFTAEGEVAYGQVVDMKLRPLGRHVSLPWPEGLQHGTANRKRTHAPSPTPSDEVLEQPLAVLRPAPVMAAAAPPVIAPAGAVVPVAMVVPAMPVMGRVPAKFLRDHAILHALCLCLKPQCKSSSIRVSLDEVAAVCRGVAPVFTDQTDQSMKQACRYVCDQVIKKAKEHAAKTGHMYTIEYNSTRDRHTDGRVGGVMAEGPGVAFLFQFTGWVVNQMRFNGDSFDWHVSRSMASRAASTARKLAAAPALGGPWAS